jgi:uncharacterized protein YkwD
MTSIAIAHERVQRPVRLHARFEAWEHLLVGTSFALGVFLASSPAQGLLLGVTIHASTTTATATSVVTFNGSASANQTVSLQRRGSSTFTWETIASRSADSSGAYSFGLPVATGTYSYRARAGLFTSSSVTVGGNYARNVAVPAAGEPFTLSGRLPHAQARDVQVQWLSGGAWTTRGHAPSSTTGLVGVRTYTKASATVRLYAPATSSYPTAWVGPAGSVAVGTDPVIARILSDTNRDRAQHGLAALKLRAEINTVAGNWAYSMHQNCSHSHNPNYKVQVPAGWHGVAENIAWGYLYTAVVPAWLDSSGHRANIEGNYSQIGIGYYFGPKCDKRYYVQNFARY